jgi:hypothetical protein
MSARAVEFSSISCIRCHGDLLFRGVASFEKEAFWLCECSQCGTQAVIWVDCAKDQLELFMMCSEGSCSEQQKQENYQLSNGSAFVVS